jgi:hypothetical protein
VGGREREITEKFKDRSSEVVDVFKKIKKMN